ncbi:MAG: tetratricopeptide repeat protein [Desulfamplus sp.]|nr:tetratricopeptide repeat protein [Desulfamplus sp.]
MSIDQMNRYLFLAMNKLPDAEKISTDLLERYPEDKKNIAYHYNIGLSYAKAGKYKNAKTIFLSILDKYHCNPEISSWCAFKLGEILLEEGDLEKSKTLFLKAVQYKPDHFKAKILLTGKQNPLIVNMDRSCNQYRAKYSCQYLSTSDHNNKQYDFHGKTINIPMNIFNEELWKYYFGTKKIDYITVPLHIYTSQNDLTHLTKILRCYVEKNAMVYLKLKGVSIQDEKANNNYEENHIKDIIDLFRINALSFISIKRNILQFKNNYY